MTRCKICRQEFVKRSISHKVCGQDCAMKYAELERQKKERKELRAAKERVKSRAQWLKEAQTAFNKTILLRDADEPCISCGRHHQGQYHAGHYRSTKAAPELRFEPMNVHKQCMPCNTYLSGNILEYRKRLLEKIGLEKLDWLEGKHEAKHHTIDDLKLLKSQFMKMGRETK